MNKKRELRLLVAEKNPDIICVSEFLPKFSKPITRPEFALVGYDDFSNLTTAKRGVLIYVRKNLKACKTIDIIDEFDENVWCDVKTNNGRMLVGCVYRSPNSPKENNDKMCTALSKIAMNTSATQTVVVGDINLSDLQWKGSDRSASSKSLKFVDTFKESFLTQHVDQPTHFRPDCQPTTIDLVLTSHDEVISDICYEAPLGKSHHLTLSFDVDCSTTKGATVKRPNYNAADYNKMRTELRETDWSTLYQADGTQKAWDCFDDAIKSVEQKYIPTKNCHANGSPIQPPWSNEETKMKKSDKNYAFQRFLNSKTKDNYDKYIEARDKFDLASESAVRDFERNIAAEVKTNPKAFFAYARSKTTVRDSVSDLKAPTGGVASTDCDKAEVLNNHFANVFTIEEDNEELPTPKQRTEIDPTPDLVITRDKVLKELKALKPNKSPGLDNQHPRVLSEVAEEICDPVTHIANLSLHEGKLPKQWKEAVVIPIFKKGQKCDPGNYRPVSLASIICKLIEKLIREALLDHLKKHDIVCKNQHGFISGRSCSTNLLIALDHWTKSLEDGIPTDVIYLDYAKAFDTVPHKRLIAKLKSLGVSGNLLLWITDFLSDRQQCVRVGQSISQWRNVTSGIPQGSVLGPILFVCFINDLPDNLISNSLIFADDTKVYSEICEERDSQKLQSDLNSLMDWSDKWLLRFNASKCKVLHIGANNPKHEYRMGDVVIETSECEKDLGVYVDSNLNFRGHVEQKVDTADKILRMIKRAYVYLDGDSVKKLFIALVRPHLEYCHAAWYPIYKEDRQEIERVLRRATKLAPEIRNLEFEQRLEALDIPSMKYRQERGDVIEVWKYKNGVYDVDCSSDFLKECPNNTRGHQFKLDKMRAQKPARKNFLPLRVFDDWNGLSRAAVSAKTINEFKNHVDREWSHRKYVSYFS